MGKYLFGKIYQICKTSENQWHLNHNALSHSLSPLAELEENSSLGWCGQKDRIPIPSVPIQGMQYFTRRNRPTTFLIPSNFTSQRLSSW